MTLEVTNGIRFIVTLVQPESASNQMNIGNLEDHVIITSDNNIDIDAVSFTQTFDVHGFLSTDSPIPENELVILHPDLIENNSDLVLKYLSAQARCLEGTRISQTRVLIVRPNAKPLDKMTIRDGLRYLPYNQFIISGLADAVGTMALPAFISGLLPGVKEPDTIPFPDQEHRSTT